MVMPPIVGTETSSPRPEPRPELRPELRPEPRRVNRALAPALSSVGQARSLVRAVLSGWHAEAICDDVELVASELVANALRHGLNLTAGEQPAPAADGDCVWISLVHTSSHLICAVSDPSRQPPIRGAADPMTGCGQGLALVESVSTCWGWSALDPRDDDPRTGPAGGKSVWAIFPLRSAAWAAGAA
jgi:hypothetical protein